MLQEISQLHVHIEAVINGPSLAGRKEVGTEVATVCARALTALELLVHPRCLPPAYVFTEAGAGRANSGSFSQDKSGYLTRGGNEYGPSGGSSKKFGYVSTDPWSELDTWLGYDEATGDDVIAHPDSSNPPNGVANGSPGNLAADRATSTHYITDGGLTSEAVKSAKIDGAYQTPHYGPNRFEPAEDLMEIETEASAPNGLSLVRETNEVGSTVLVSRLNDSSAKQGVDESSATPNAANTAEPKSQGEELQNPQRVAASSDLVTVTRGLATSTIVKTLVTCSTSQGNLETGSVLESETFKMESVEVTTSGVSLAKDQPQQFPEVAHDVGSDSDSDGPLPAIVDGDPDSESD